MIGTCQWPWRSEAGWCRAIAYQITDYRHILCPDHIGRWRELRRTGATCLQCGRRVWPTGDYGTTWTDGHKPDETLGSGLICLAGPKLTHQASPGGSAMAIST